MKKNLIVRIMMVVMVLAGFVGGLGVGQVRASILDDNSLNDIRARLDSMRPRPANPDCVVTGCANELCMPKGTDINVSPCVMKEEYACYKSAACEKQTDGVCGWTQTPTLQQCIGNANLPKPTMTPVPTRFFTPTPTKAANPICGNKICEVGESSYWDCDSCRGLFCSDRSCVLKLGVCTTDCPPVSTQPPTVTPTPTKVPRTFPTISLRKSPTPTIVVSVTPTSVSDGDSNSSWMSDLWERLSELF